jgi:hypothetical protein
LQEQIYLIWRFTVFPVSPKKKCFNGKSEATVGVFENFQIISKTSAALAWTKMYTFAKFSNKSVWKNIRGKRWWGGRYVGKDKPEDKEKIMEP